MIKDRHFTQTHVLFFKTIADSITDESRAKLEDDKLRIQQDKTMAEEEKSRLLMEKETKLHELEKQQKAKEALAAKIEVKMNRTSP